MYTKLIFGIHNLYKLFRSGDLRDISEVDRYFIAFYGMNLESTGFLHPFFQYDPSMVEPTCYQPFLR